jgi:hypothetical protein
MQAVNGVYVAVTSLAAFLGCLIALRQIAAALRRRWIEDAEHARAQRENTKALQDLTSTVGKVVSTLDDHERRLTNAHL